MSLGLLFTYLLTYGGAVVSFWRPYYGFLVYVCFSIIKPESLWFWSVPRGHYSWIIAVSFLTGWALHGFGTWSFGQAKKPAIALACYWCWAAISTMFCAVPAMGIDFLSNSGKIVLPTIAGLTLINSRKDVYQLAWTITASLGYVAYDLNNSYYEGFNRLEFIGFGGMDNNSMAIGLVTGVGFAFFLGLSEKVMWRRYLAFAAAALMTNAVFFSFSRGAMLGLCVVGAATALVMPKTTKSIALVCLGGFLALALAGDQVRDRFMSIFGVSVVAGEGQQADWSAESRLHLWKICIQMTMENPILGKGPEHFIIHVGEYSIEAAKGRFGQGKEAHTLWLQIAAELGIPGLLFLVSYYVLTMVALWKYTRYDKVDSQGLTPGATARMVWAALAGFVVSAQFVSLEGLELPYYVTLVGMGSLKLQFMEEAAGTADEVSPSSIQAGYAA